MKKILPLLLFVIFSSRATEQPAVKTKPLAVAPASYFTPEHLEQLKKQGTSVHAPCLLLLDPENKENPKNKAFVVTIMLLNGIQTELPLIITSKSLIHNLPHFQEMVEVDLAEQGLSTTDHLQALERLSISLSSKNWQLFFVPESDLAVLVPRKFTQLYKNKGLTLHNLEEQTKLLDDTDALQQATQYQETSNPYEVAGNLKKIFQRYTTNTLTDPSMPIWDTFIHGHGSPNDFIAGVPITNMQDLLTFFNTHIATGSALIHSCYAAGQNSTLLQVKKELSKTKRIQFELNQLKYPLFVLGYPDSTTLGLTLNQYNRRFLEEFFTNAAQLKQQKSLGELLNAMDTLNQELDIQRATNIPQVWLPGGIGFQSYTTDKMIFALGPVRARAHEQEKRPIKLSSDTRAVLLYAKNLQVPIIVNQPIKQVEDEPAFVQVKEYLPGISLEWSYPRLLSMLPGDNTHAFSSIILPKKPPQAFLGVLTFIAQSLITFHDSQRTFLVDALEGQNDFVPLIVTSMDLKAKTKKDLEQLPPLAQKSYQKGGHVTLEQLIVQTKEQIDADIKELKVSFILDGEGWEFDNTKSKEYWNFKKIDPDEHRKAYGREKAKLHLQPSLYEQIVQVAQDKQEMWFSLLIPIYPCLYGGVMINLLKKSYFLENQKSALMHYVWYLYSNAPPLKEESYTDTENLIQKRLSNRVKKLSKSKTYEYKEPKVEDIINQQTKLIEKFSKKAQEKAKSIQNTRIKIKGLQSQEGLQNQLNFINRTFIDLNFKANLSAFLAKNMKPLQHLYDKEFTQSDKSISARNYLPIIMLSPPAGSFFSTQPELTRFKIEVEKSKNDITLIQPSHPNDVVLLITSLVSSVSQFFTERKDLQEHTFLIKNITGYNDLSVLIEIIQILHGERFFLPWLDDAKFLNKLITLKSVIITVKETMTDAYRPQVTIEAILDNHGIRIATSYITVEKEARTPSWIIEEIKPKSIQDKFDQALNTL